MKQKLRPLEVFMNLLFFVCGLIAVVFVLFISIYLIVSGLPAIPMIGLVDFLFGTEWASTAADPTMQGVIAILALAANVIVLAIIIKRSVEQEKNPYKNEIFTDHRDYRQAMARAEAIR